jgi:hypothetical protein
VQLRRDLQSSEISVPIRVTSGNRGGIRQLRVNHQVQSKLGKPIAVLSPFSIGFANKFRKTDIEA